MRPFFQGTNKVMLEDNARGKIKSEDPIRIKNVSLLINLPITILTLDNF